MYLDRLRLDGRLAFITGGGRGIGLACAHAMLEAGARVVISDVNPDILGQGQEELRALGFKADGLVLDVTRPDDVTIAAETVRQRHGHADIVVANAGMAWPDTGAEEMPDDVWLRIVDVNLNGCFWTCRAFAPRMLERGKGSIVTLGSMSGLISNKPQRQAHYNAAKAGVHHLTRSLAGEWAERGVRVNCVAPTYVDTLMSRGGMEDETMFPIWMENTPMKRVAKADEIASAVLFLVGDGASAITGTVLTVDCGYTIW
ncbi:SDR family NAD(P)-dependent oxidoreductase [Chelativorans sp. M5D2P16]|uniref:SDR family NAD(P)-dependent oxidoreductase n=1 Tax=Chelativorans sp. M5D2P16 TaxID=3095678 RepID=UPI002ACA4882|nr:SDR family oxidoreductase [Chelativorans sp. M5D2P16]MDZ5698669.1 SDR family oxidoreductase [Chelativorans sp. M5D2P16]